MPLPASPSLWLCLLEAALFGAGAAAAFGGREDVVTPLAESERAFEWNGRLRYAHRARPVHLVTLGGSASAYTPNYGNYLAEMASAEQGEGEHGPSRHKFSLINAVLQARWSRQILRTACPAAIGLCASWMC